MRRMKLWKALAVIVSALSLFSCGSPQVLDVRPLHIRQVRVDDSDDPMIRGELHMPISFALHWPLPSAQSPVYWPAPRGLTCT